MNRRGFFQAVAVLFSALFVKREPVKWKSKMWHDVGAFYENGHWVTYYPPTEFPSDSILYGSQTQFKSTRLTRNY